MYKKKFLFTLSIGLATCRREEEVELEFDDKYTEEEIEEIVSQEWKEWVWNYIDGGPLKIEGE